MRLMLRPSLQGRTGTWIRLQVSSYSPRLTSASGEPVVAMDVGTVPTGEPAAPVGSDPRRPIRSISTRR